MSDVVRFPPLPPIPIRPAQPGDERQQTLHRIVGVIVDGLPEEGNVGMINTVAGFRASAVDLGALQNMIEDGLGRLDMNQIRERREDDVRRWLIELLRSWVQRCKFMHFDLAEKGIHIKIQTQDDRGYYEYEFDAFPGRARQST
jgi:hypothetical protein